MRLIRVQKVWLISAPFREGGVSAPHRNQSQRAPIGELGEPAAVKSTKMQGACSRISGRQEVACSSIFAIFTYDSMGNRKRLSQFWASFPITHQPIQKTLAIHRMMREFFVNSLQWFVRKNQFETAPFVFRSKFFPD